MYYFFVSENVIRLGEKAATHTHHVYAWAEGNTTKLNTAPMRWWCFADVITQKVNLSPKWNVPHIMWCFTRMSTIRKSFVFPPLSLFPFVLIRCVFLSMFRLRSKFLGLHWQSHVYSFHFIYCCAYCTPWCARLHTVQLHSAIFSTLCFALISLYFIVYYVIRLNIKDNDKITA